MRNKIALGVVIGRQRLKIAADRSDHAFHAPLKLKCYAQKVAE